MRAVKMKTGSMHPGLMPIVRRIELVVLIATILALLSAGYPPMQAGANQFKQTVIYTPKKNWGDITTTVTMDLHAPGYPHLPPGLKENPNLYWLQIWVSPVVEVDFEFDVYGHNVLEKGKGHWISARSPGEIMIAVEDKNASLGRLQKLYYRETEGYSDTKFRDYSKLATSTEKWPTDYHKEFGRYHNPNFKTVTDQLQDAWGSLKGKVPFFNEAVPTANFLLGFHPMLGPALSTLQMWPLVTEVMESTPEWVFTTKIPGVYQDGSDEKLREPLPVFSDDKNFDIHTYSWLFLLHSGVKTAGDRAPNQILELNYFFELHREKPEETLLYIRAIIPHHVVAAAGNREKWIEVEWEQLLPALQEVPPQQERYQLVPRWRTWEDAKTDCEKRGGHLVTIDSDEENEIVARLLIDGSYPHAWIGLSDRATDKTHRSWEWVTTANMKTMSYRRWGEGQPDELKEYYVDIRSDGTWNDWCQKPNEDSRTTKYKMPYVCEFEPVKPKEDPKPAQKKKVVTEPEEPEGEYPTIVIWTTPKEVRIGETFIVYLRAKDDVKLESMWWTGENTGVPELDKQHTARIFGTDAASNWPITATEEGTFTLVADVQDHEGHKASESQGITRATVKVTGTEQSQQETPAGKLTLWSVFDNHSKTDLSNYQFVIKLNGKNIFSGTPSSIEHATIKAPLKDISNFKPFEIEFDRSLLQKGHNNLEISVSGVDGQHWFCWNYFDVGGPGIESTRYMPAGKHDADHREFLGIVEYPASSGSWPYGGTGKTDGVYGGQSASITFLY